MCRSDSGADTRDSENTFPASMAEEKKQEAGGKPDRLKRIVKERKKKVSEDEMKKGDNRGKKKYIFSHYLFNFLVSNFSPIVSISFVATVIKHFGHAGDFLFLKPPCQYKAPELN